MHYLGTPHADGKTVLHSIIAAKHAPVNNRLYEVSPVVFECYENYIKHTDDLALVNSVALTDIQKDALIHAFDVPTKPMTELRQSFIESCTLCPFCRLSETATLDHYLPKTKFPEFSVFPQNLIPCCPTCNSKKNSLIVDQFNNTLLFLHPYFDQIPSEEFLSLSIKIDNDVLILKFQINKTRNMTKEEFDRISKHFEILKLGDRYRRMSLDSLRKKRDGLEKRFKTPEKEIAVSRYLKDEADSITKSHGRNNWKAVLFSTLADSNIFCNEGFAVIPG